MGPDNVALLIPIIALLIPISAITLGIGSKIISNILSSQERRLELRLQTQQGRNDDVIQQIEALRAEIARLRDTSTQFDISLENSMQHLVERVSRLEAKATPPAMVSQPEEPRQTVGRSRG